MLLHPTTTEAPEGQYNAFIFNPKLCVLSSKLSLAALCLIQEVIPES